MDWLQYARPFPQWIIDDAYDAALTHTCDRVRHEMTASYGDPDVAYWLTRMLVTLALKPMPPFTARSADVPHMPFIQPYIDAKTEP